MGGRAIARMAARRGMALRQELRSMNWYLKASA
jgi:hypothetical protein